MFGFFAGFVMGSFTLFMVLLWFWDHHGGECCDDDRVHRGSEGRHGH